MTFELLKKRREKYLKLQRELGEEQRATPSAYTTPSASLNRKVFLLLKSSHNPQQKPHKK